jgi:hypothetical protein
MAVTPSIRRDENEVSRCIHCVGSGSVYEPTEDSLEDEAHVCWMCDGTGRR